MSSRRERAPIRTFDLRLWVTADPPGPALERFFAEVKELTEAHPGIEPRWTCERTDRHGRPRIRVHPPPREFDSTKARPS